uniref:Uncharacterized protein n=1 Tax=Spironucleus salmonicida TaxID=348837 RepID=V6LKS7_9EUKA|eukprot:EST44341.1 Hypothetical protein SS50377_15806 [Spironucleus salmonicida]
MMRVRRTSKSYSVKPKGRDTPWGCRARTNTRLRWTYFRITSLTLTCILLLSVVALKECRTWRPFNISYQMCPRTLHLEDYRSQKLEYTPSSHLCIDRQCLQNTGPTKMSLPSILLPSWSRYFTSRCLQRRQRLSERAYHRSATARLTDAGASPSTYTNQGL